MHTVYTRAVGHSRRLLINPTKEPTFCLHIHKAHILGSSTGLSMLRESGPNSESCYPLLSCLIFRPLFNGYHNAHTEAEGRFILAPKVAPNPNEQQLNTTNKISFAFPFYSSLEIE